MIIIKMALTVTKEIKNFGKCFGTEDFKEGTTAFFLEKKKES
jgi:enoyl-CoA hydratase